MDFFMENPKDVKNIKKIESHSICKCGKAQLIFNYTGQKRTICCNKCKEEGMIDIKNKKQQYIVVNVKRKEWVNIRKKKYQCGKA